MARLKIKGQDLLIFSYENQIPNPMTFGMTTTFKFREWPLCWAIHKAPTACDINKTLIVASLQPSCVQRNDANLLLSGYCHPASIWPATIQQNQH